MILHWSINIILAAAVFAGITLAVRQCWFDSLRRKQLVSEGKVARIGGLLSGRERVSEIVDFRGKYGREIWVIPPDAKAGTHFETSGKLILPTPSRKVVRKLAVEYGCPVSRIDSMWT